MFYTSAHLSITKAT